MSYLRQLDLAEPALLSRSDYDDRMNRRSSLAIIGVTPHGNEEKRTSRQALWSLAPHTP